jgi:hypothetical protein
VFDRVKYNRPLDEKDEIIKKEVLQRFINLLCSDDMVNIEVKERDIGSVRYMDEKDKELEGVDDESLKSIIRKDENERTDDENRIYLIMQEKLRGMRLSELRVEEMDRMFAEIGRNDIIFDLDLKHLAKKSLFPNRDEIPNIQTKEGFERFKQENLDSFDLLDDTKKSLESGDDVEYVDRVRNINDKFKVTYGPILVLAMTVCPFAAIFGPFMTMIQAMSPALFPLGKEFDKNAQVVDTIENRYAKEKTFLREFRKTLESPTQNPDGGEAPRNASRPADENPTDLTGKGQQRKLAREAGAAQNGM